MLSAITRPTLLVNIAQVERNIQRMVGKTAAAGVILRPHFKTHQSAAIGQLFHAHGVRHITVSSLDMALYFAEAGWQDITVAIPANVREIDKINTLAQRIKLGLLVENPTTAAILAQQVAHPVQIWLEVDTGYGRTGVWHEDTAAIAAILDHLRSAPDLQWAGVLTHAGHSYRARSKAELTAVHEETLGRMQAVQQFVLGQGWPTCPISIGDTPTATALDDWAGVAELRPGNFVFYDLMQAQIGVCASEEIAVAVACPVIALYPQRQQVMLYGGAVHFGKEQLVEANGRIVYGYLADSTPQSPFGAAVPTAALTALSQEHGTLTIADPALLGHIRVGDVLTILPVHSCLTADLYDNYVGLDGQRYGRMPRQGA